MFLIRILQRTSPQGHGIILVVLLISRIFVFFHKGEIPVFYQLDSNPIWASFFQWIHASRLLNYLIGVLLLYGSAITLNTIVNNHQLLPQKGHLTAYFFVLCSSMIPEFAWVSPPMMIQWVLVLTWGIVLTIFASKNPIDKIFLSGVLMGLMVFFGFSYAPFYGFVWVSVLVFRPFHIKEWFASLLGFMIPLLPAYAIHYVVYDDLMAIPYKIPVLDLKAVLSYIQYPSFIVVIILLMLSTVEVITRLITYSVKIRRTIQLLGFYTILCVFITVFGYEDPRVESLFLAVPFAIMLAFYFSYERQLGWYKNLFHWVFLITCLGVPLWWVLS
jgi:hypothetical protein